MSEGQGRQKPRSYLLVIGHMEGLAWVLKNSRMAFTAHRARAGQQLRVGDRLFLYTSRGCFGNPTRDRGRVIGDGVVRTLVARRPRPVEIAGIWFTHDCVITLRSLTEYRQGLELAPLVGRLRAFPDKQAWSARLRQPLLELPDADSRLIQVRLAALAGPLETRIPTYLQK